MSGEAKHIHIKQAFELDEEPDKIKDYYQSWADTYDKDVAEESYYAPATMVRMLMEQLDLSEGSSPVNQIKILDAGCGTGLVGECLYSQGFRDLTGFDLSLEMIEKAAERKIYKNLIADTDLMLPLEPQIHSSNFEMIACVGVFTHGHVPPEGLLQLIDVAQEGALIGVNARETYADESGFENYCEELASQGKLELLQRTHEQSTGDSRAYFLVFRRL